MAEANARLRYEDKCSQTLDLTENAAETSAKQLEEKTDCSNLMVRAESLFNVHLEQAAVAFSKEFGGNDTKLSAGMCLAVNQNSQIIAFQHTIDEFMIKRVRGVSALPSELRNVYHAIAIGGRYASQGNAHICATLCKGIDMFKQPLVQEACESMPRYTCFPHMSEWSLQGPFAFCAR